MAMRRWTPYFLVAVPGAFLTVFFVLPAISLLSASFMEYDGSYPTGDWTLENFELLLTRPLYINAIIRTFVVGASVGAVVVLLAYPLAYFLVRTTSPWRNWLIALSLAPLLASVIVRTYGWWVMLNRDGAINTALLAIGFVDRPLRMLPSTFAIILGLSHALLPYGVLTIMASLNGLNPNLERAAMGLGASRLRTFLTVTLPLTAPGIIGGFLLAFAIAISAYATPAILGGPATEVMATLIRNFMVSALDWGPGAAMGTILILSSFVFLVLTSWFGERRNRA
jgi:putative spermidine/putrescine transport system permease protein